MKNNSKPDEYLKIKSRQRYEEKVRDSRFIATATPVSTAQQAEEFIEEIRKEFHDASHNCSAWKVGKGDGSRYKYNDDGEPSGTAGRPILKAIETRELSDICLVVTRYFGGTKLGTGGLMRAYGQAASELLKKCDIEKNYVTRSASFSADFDFMGVIHNVINNFKADLKDSVYGDDVLFIVEVKSADFQNFRDKLIEATNGQVRFK